MVWLIQKNARKHRDADAGKGLRAELERCVDRQSSIEGKVKESGKLSRCSADIRLMLSMMRDYWYGNYRSVPWKTIAAVAGALIYVMNPLDVIPDLIFGFGLVDDAGVVALCLKLVESDIHRYAAWKEQQEELERTHQTN